MEGGMLPWRTQRIVNNSPDLDSYGKPLPPPPSGYFWERCPDKSWVLQHVKNKTNEEGEITFTEPSVIEHVVMPGDTLQGICLRYRVSALEVRRTNVFSGNNIQIKKVLRIPIEANTIVRLQEETPEVLIQKFKNITNEGTQESRIYLEECNWNFQEAINKWKSDEHWDKNNKPHVGFSSDMIADESSHPVVHSEPGVIPQAIVAVKEVAPRAIANNAMEVLAIEVNSSEQIELQGWNYVNSAGEIFDPTLEPLIPLV